MSIWDDAFEQFRAANLSEGEFLPEVETEDQAEVEIQDDPGNRIIKIVAYMSESDAKVLEREQKLASLETKLKAADKRIKQLEIELTKAAKLLRKHSAQDKPKTDKTDA